MGAERQPALDGAHTRHWAPLDGLRAVAALGVLVDHARLPGFGAGGLGVDVFFTLSGFLITNILVEEWAKRGEVDLGRFWLRRVLRLYPALLALVLGILLLAPWLPAATLEGVTPALLYFANWRRALVGDIGALGHTWSLSVEEQFYLIWPLVLLLLLRTRGGARSALQAVLAGAFLVTVVREIVFQAHLLPYDRIYNGSDFRSDGLLIGCALALAAHIGPLPAWLTSPKTLTVMLAVYAATFFGWALVAPPSFLGRAIASATAASIIAATVSGASSPALTLLAHPIARWLGARSYAIYLWHFPIVMVLASQPTALRVPAVLALTIAAAALSYRYVEAPALALRQRLRPAVG